MYEDVIYTRHAAARILERAIDRAQVTALVERTSKILGKKEVRLSSGGLTVVTKMVGGKIRVITAWTEKK